MLKVFITGSAGFIGYHVAKRFIEQGHEVVGVDNFNSTYSPCLKRRRIELLHRMGGQFTNYELDIANAIALDGLFERYSHFDLVVHLAAQTGVRYSLVNPKAYGRANMIGFMNVLECCRDFEIDHLIYASSSSVYGLNQLLPFCVSDDTDHPVSLYAATKRSNELMAHSYSHLFNIPTTGLRFFSTYGPWGRPDMVMYIFTEAILEERPIDLRNAGNMERDFTYIDDIVEAIYRLASLPATPDPNWNATDPNPVTSSAPWRLYNIGNGAPVGLNRLVDVLENLLQRKATRRLVDLQPGEVIREWGNVDLLQQAIGFQPSTPIEEGVQYFLEWYFKYKAGLV